MLGKEDWVTVVCSLPVLGVLCGLCMWASLMGMHAPQLCLSLCHSPYRSSVSVLDLTSNTAHQLALPVEVKQLLVVSSQQWIVEDSAGYGACPFGTGQPLNGSENASL